VYGNERISVRSTKKESGYYLYDGRGSVTGIVSVMGERLESYSYDPAGNVTRATSTNRYQKTFYGYNGESYDPKTGSVYLRARYYNTRTGSFQSKDTYLGSLMDPLSQNRYAYTQGNPVNYQDPSGLEKIVVSGGAYGTCGWSINKYIEDIKKGDGVKEKISEILSDPFKYHTGNKYAFIATATKKIDEYNIDDNQDETITWIIADSGWSEADKKALKSHFYSSVPVANPSEYRNKPVVNVVFINDINELTNYINSKDVNNGELTNARETDKITEFTVFSHGSYKDSGILMLGYNETDNYNTRLNLNVKGIEKIKSEAFAAKSKSEFYSCNLAIDKEDGFAKKWADMTGGYVMAFNGRTDYSYIYGANEIDEYSKAIRRLGKYNHINAENYPIPGQQTDPKNGDHLPAVTETVIYQRTKRQ